MPRNVHIDEIPESGLGLGLFIVRSVVERHGGSVSLTRTDTNRTRAEVVLPRERPGVGEPAVVEPR